MDQEDYGRFLSAQGLRTVKAAGELWVEKRKLFLENIPPHRRIRLDRWNAMKLFLRGYAVLRYSCEEAEGRPSFEYICDDRNYDLHSLGHKARNQTRQGLKNCVVRPINFDLLSDQGVPINRSVFARQGRPGPPFLAEERLWKQYMRACRSMQDVEAWGAHVDEQLCAFVIVVFVDDYAYLFHPHALSESLKHRPMNALVFSVVQALLLRPMVKRVSYGLEPFLSLPALEDFKISMGFRRSSIGRRIVVNLLARPFLTRPVERVARGLVASGRFKGVLGDFLTFTQSFREQSLSGKHTEARL